MNKIYQIFKQYKYKLITIYLFMLFTELAIISQPYLLGKTVDDLIDGNFFWIIFLALSYFISNFFTYKRMVYTQIYNNIVISFLKKTNTDNSKKIARTDMDRDIVNVLEGYVHYYIATIITIFGSIGFIYSENWRVGILITTALVFIILGVLLYYKKIRQSVNARNNHYENKVDAIQNGYKPPISFFNRKRKLDIYESTLQGKNWFIAGTIKNIFLLLSILTLVKTSDNITAGSIITI